MALLTSPCYRPPVPSTHVHFRRARIPRHGGWNDTLSLGPWNRGDRPFGLHSDSTLDEDNWGHCSRKETRELRVRQVLCPLHGQAPKGSPRPRSARWVLPFSSTCGWLD